VNLQQLNLAGNLLNGSIPSGIGLLTNLLWIYLERNQLSGSIPAEIGNLTQLVRLRIHNNKLSGSIPASIGHLNSIQDMYVYNNPGLNGTVSPNCGVKVLAVNTSLTAICGCASSSSIPISMPNPDNISAVCLAAYSNITQNDHYEFLCSMESNKNPKQDCLNSLAFFCGRSHIQGRPDVIAGCKRCVDDHFSRMNSFWISWRKECGKWAWAGWYIGNATSSKCSTAKLALQQNANYTEADGTIVPVSLAVIDSIKAGLWDNPFL